MKRLRPWVWYYPVYYQWCREQGREPLSVGEWMHRTTQPKKPTADQLIDQWLATRREHSDQT